MTEDPIREEKDVIVVDDSEFEKTRARYRALRDEKRREAAVVEETDPHPPAPVASGTKR